MGRGRGDGGIIAGAGACCCFIVVVVTVSMVAASFKSVDEADFCLRYNKYTKVVQKEVYADAGSFYVGLSDDFICYPKQIINIEFSESPDSDRGRLGARSIEGLNVVLDINVEFKLVPDKIFNVFQEIGLHFKQSFVRIARSELRNTASRFPALDFLNENRANISNAMLLHLQDVFQSRHAEALDVQLRRVYLPAEYDAAIKRVEEMKLEAKKATEERNVTLARLNQNNQTAVIQLLADREAILLTETTNIERARLEQEAAIIVEEVAGEILDLEVITNRSNIYLSAEADIEKAISARNAALTVERAEQEKAVIQFGTQLAEVAAEAEIIRIAANASVEALLIEQAAIVDAFEKMQAVEREALVALRAANPGMNGTAVLQYQWFKVLSQMQDTLFTLDYKKVPFFLEGDSSSGRRAADVDDAAFAFQQDLVGTVDLEEY